MKKILPIIIFTASFYLSETEAQELQSFYNISAQSIDGQPIIMEKYRGKKVLIVNVASKCGFAPQYEGLQELHEIYGESVAVLGFPSNDFFWQEPGTNSDIQKFCRTNYGVTFQMFEKIHVKGKNQHPIYKWLSDSKLNGWNNKYSSWNFCKYLIDEKGKLIDYFSQSINPLDTVITRYFKLELPSNQ